jgi:hypothetical protein
VPPSELDTAGGEGVADVAGVGYRARKAVSLGICTLSEGLGQAGPVAVRSGQTVVQVDPVLRDVQTEQDPALGGEVLLVQTASRVADAFAHAGSVR